MIYADIPHSRSWRITPYCSEFFPRVWKAGERGQRGGESNFRVGTPDKHILSQDQDQGQIVTSQADSRHPWHDAVRMALYWRSHFNQEKIIRQTLTEGHSVKYPTSTPPRACNMWACWVMSDSLQPYGLLPTRHLCSRSFPEMGCHFLLQEMASS